MECSAARVAFGRPNASAMPLDDGLANREAQAHAIFLRRDKGLKQPPRYFFGKAGSAIQYADLHEVVVCLSRDDQFASRQALHRFDGIADEIDQNLLQLNLVDADGR